MSFAFDEAVAVGHAEHLTEGGRSLHRYHIQIQEKFSAGGAPFGGIIFASVINALSKDFADSKNDSTVDKKKTGKARWPHPLSAQCTFLSISKIGAAYVDVRRLKEGGRSAVAEAVLRQDQQTKSGGYETVDILVVVATFGDLAAEEGPDYVTETSPPIEFSQGQVDWRAMPGAGVQDIVERTTKLPPLRPGVLTPQPVVYHASRFRDQRPTDVVALAFWADMFNSPVRRIPELQEKGFRGMTMDLSIQFRSLPNGSLIYTRVWTRHLTRGRYDCTCELWDEAGNLVCLATQTRMMRGLTGGWKVEGRNAKKVEAKI